jgi:hypothetical protein
MKVVLCIFYLSLILIKIIKTIAKERVLAEYSEINGLNISFIE